jgi:hypothetical protein
VREYPGGPLAVFNSPRCLALFEAKGGNRDANEPLTPLGGSAANGLLQNLTVRPVTQGGRKAYKFLQDADALRRCRRWLSGR